MGRGHLIDMSRVVKLVVNLVVSFVVIHLQACRLVLHQVIMLVHGQVNDRMTPYVEMVRDIRPKRVIDHLSTKVLAQNIAVILRHDRMDRHLMRVRRNRVRHSLIDPMRQIAVHKRLIIRVADFRASLLLAGLMIVVKIVLQEKVVNNVVIRVERKNSRLKADMILLEKVVVVAVVRQEIVTLENRIN